MQQSKYYNRGRRDVTFKVGDLANKLAHFYSRKNQNVLSKLVKPFEGPYVIVKVCLPGVYELASQYGGLKGRYHISNLFKYVDPDQPEDKELTPEEAAALDRELLKIHDSYAEGEPIAQGEPEDEMVWVAEPTRKRPADQDVDEGPSRKRLRNRSYSYGG